MSEKKEHGIPNEQAEKTPRFQSEESGISRLARRFGNIRKAAEEQINQFKATLDLASQPEYKDKEKITPENLTAEIEELRTHDLSPSQAIIKWGQLEAKIKPETRQYGIKTQRAHSQYERISSYIREVNTRLESLEETNNPIYKITNIFTRARLNRQKRNYVDQAEKIRLQINSESTVYKNMQSLEDESYINYKNAIKKQGLKDIATISEGYEDIASRLLQDNQITDEIRKNFIFGKIDALPGGENLSDTEKHDIYTAYTGYLAEIQSKPEDAHNAFINFRAALKDGNIADHMTSSCRQIESGEEKDLILDIIVLSQAKDIKQIMNIISSKVKDYEFKQIYDSINDILTPPNSIFRGPDKILPAYFKKLRDLLRSNSSYKAINNAFPDMELWNSIKNSPAAMEVMGDLIKEKDEHIYKATLRESLDDRGADHVTRLENYPTPEGIKVLLLSAAASGRQDSNVPANNVLTRLAKRSDWPKLLDEAEKKYPELEPARKSLENWDFHDYGSKPGIREDLSRFNLALIRDPEENDVIKTKATLSLPNSSMFELLLERGLLKDQKSIKAIVDAENYLEDLKQQYWTSIDKDKVTDIPNLEYFTLSTAVRKQLLGLCLYGNQENVYYKNTLAITRLSILSQKILEIKESKSANKYDSLLFLRNSNVIDKVISSDFTPDQTEAFLVSYRNCRDVINDPDLFKMYVYQYDGPETPVFFNNMIRDYGDKKPQLFSILGLVGQKALSRDRAQELPQKAQTVLSSKLFSAAISYPQLFLSTDENVLFFNRIESKYQTDEKIFIEISHAINSNKISREAAFTFPQKAPALMHENMKDIRSLILINNPEMIKDDLDLIFFNRLVGEFGKKSDFIIKGYIECLKKGVVTTTDRDLIFEFSKQFRVITPDIIKGYKQAKESGVEQAFIAHLKSLAEKMTAGGITDEERKNPYFKDLILHVYPNNSSSWTDYEKNASCSDRSGDIETYNIKPRYDIDLLSQGHIRIVEGATPDPKVQEEMSAPVYKIAEELGKSEYDPEKIKQELDKQLSTRIKEIIEHGGLQGIDPDSLNTTEERLFLVMTDSIYGSKSLSIESIKNLIITYEFANFEDVREYIKGTNDRVSHATNRDYALLCELGQFYSDRIKEVNRRLVEKAWDNPEISTLMPEYFKKLSEETLTSESLDKINRLQVDKLGLNDSFAIQIGKMLEKRKRRKYTPEQVRELISRYESKTGGLQEKASTSENKQTKAIYGQLKSQREKTIRAIEEITGEKKDPSQFHLGEINLQQLLDTERNIVESKYDPDQFASYTAQRFIDIFGAEKEKIENELGKYESESGNKREILYGYITKSKESANARAVGGVCVAGDNPAKNNEKNMWDMPNFFQMVLADPDTLQCQGLVMLHSLVQGDQKILTASINPSSTYLYSVDEQALFKGIMASLESFANDNGFDMITLSQNKTIRTNRTGGQFENAIDERIASVEKPFKFETPQRFSYSPNYQLQDMDTVWERPLVA